VVITEEDEECDEVGGGVDELELELEHFFSGYITTQLSLQSFIQVSPVFLESLHQVTHSLLALVSSQPQGGVGGS